MHYERLHIAKLIWITPFACSTDNASRDASSNTLSTQAAQLETIVKVATSLQMSESKLVRILER